MQALQHIRNADIAADALAGEYGFTPKTHRARWEIELSRDSDASRARGRQLDRRVAQRLGLAVAAPQISAAVSQRRKHEGSRA